MRTLFLLVFLLVSAARADEFIENMIKKLVSQSFEDVPEVLPAFLSSFGDFSNRLQSP